MSNQDDEATTGISDEDLPEDLQPTDENPLAQPLEDDDDATKSREELDVLGGKEPEESDESRGSDSDGTTDAGGDD